MPKTSECTCHEFRQRWDRMNAESMRPVPGKAPHLDACPLSTFVPPEKPDIEGSMWREEHDSGTHDDDKEPACEWCTNA